MVIWLVKKLLIKLVESKIWPKNNSETNKEEILREKYISQELRQNIIDDLRLKEESCWSFKILDHLILV